MTTIYAEDVNYWQSSTTSPDTWMDKAKKELKAVGGVVTGEAYGATGGRSAYMLAFRIGEDQFKIVWPVLQSRSRNERAARIQAATMLYHDVKSKCVSAKVLGGRAAFAQFLMLPNGQTVSEASSIDLAKLLPSVIMLPSGQ